MMMMTVTFDWMQCAIPVVVIGYFGFAISYNIVMRLLEKCGRHMDNIDSLLRTIHNHGKH
jgi:hypothetical protein